MLLCIFLLAGCTSNNVNEINSLNNNNENTEISETLKEPKIEWCELYNPNGFDTVTCVLSNPNNVDVDVTYDLVFCKYGIEVSRLKYFTNTEISPNHNDVIWANANVPSSKDADEVKMENIRVSESY